MKSVTTRYGAVAQSFHWLTALLVLAAFLLSEGGPEARVYSAAIEPARRLHESLGLAVFLLVLLRLIWRLFDTRPTEPAMPAWMALSARAGHLALYALLIAVPVTAIAGAGYEGHPVTLLGGTDVNPWVSASHDLGRTITEIHTLLGDVIMWVAGLHAAAALLHHFVLKDSVLVSMLPALFTRSGRGP
jgi:cytochrome b561